MRHRVELQSFSTAQNAFGEEVRTWTTFATVWASVEPLQGRELMEAQQINAETTIKIMLRYNATIESVHRVKIGSRLLDIVSVVNPQERDEHLVLMCKEAV